MRISSITSSLIMEASYAGNIGAMEVFKFFSKATPEEKEVFQHALKSKDYDTAWEMIEKVSGTKLQ